MVVVATASLAFARVWFRFTHFRPVVSCLGLVPDCVYRLTIASLCNTKKQPYDEAAASKTAKCQQQHIHNIGSTTYNHGQRHAIISPAH